MDITVMSFLLVKRAFRQYDVCPVDASNVWVRPFLFGEMDNFVM